MTRQPRGRTGRLRRARPPAFAAQTWRGPHWPARRRTPARGWLPRHVPPPAALPDGAARRTRRPRAGCTRGPDRGGRRGAGLDCAGFDGGSHRPMAGSWSARRSRLTARLPVLREGMLTWSPIPRPGRRSCGCCHASSSPGCGPDSGNQVSRSFAESPSPVRPPRLEAWHAAFRDGRGPRDTYG